MNIIIKCNNIIIDNENPIIEQMFGIIVKCGIKQMFT